jgi:hypothetical protein
MANLNELKMIERRGIMQGVYLSDASGNFFLSDFDAYRGTSRPNRSIANG